MKRAAKGCSIGLGKQQMVLEEITALIRDNDLCVLATMGADAPHASLMAYICSSDCAEIYLATSVNTLKYKNITAHADVSLLIDSRESAPRSEIQAVTITGKAEKIDDPTRKALIRDRFYDRHPHLQGLLDQPDVDVIRVRVATFQLLKGVTDIHYLSL